MHGLDVLSDLGERQFLAEFDLLLCGLDDRGGPDYATGIGLAVRADDAGVRCGIFRTGLLGLVVR